MAAYQLDTLQAGSSTWNLSTGPFSHTNFFDAIHVGDIITIMVLQTARVADGILATPDFTGTTVAPTLIAEAALADGKARLGFWRVVTTSAYAAGAWTTQVAFSVACYGAVTTNVTRDAAGPLTAADIIQVNSATTLAKSSASSWPPATLTACASVGTSQTPAAGFDFSSDGDLVFSGWAEHTGTRGATAAYMDGAENRDYTISGKGAQGFGAGVTAEYLSGSGGISLGDKTGASTPGAYIFNWPVAGFQGDFAGVSFVITATPIETGASGGLPLRLRRVNVGELPYQVHTRTL